MATKTQYVVAYQKSHPETVVGVTRGAVRLSTSTPVVLHPVAKAEDLEAMPVETLTSLHDVLVPGRKTPRQKRRLARAILPELARASRGGQRAMSGVGVRARQLLAEGATTDQVIDRISAEFPGSSITAKDVSIYRSQLRK